MSKPGAPTPGQVQQAGKILFSGLLIRGLQAFFITWGAYLATFGDRGVVAFVVACACAAYLQTCLPALPQWLEKRRPDE